MTFAKAIKDYNVTNFDKETFRIMNTDTNEVFQYDSEIVAYVITKIKSKVGDWYFCELRNMEGEYAVPYDVVERHFNVEME